MAVATWCASPAAARTFLALDEAEQAWLHAKTWVGDCRLAPL
jgi:hypothetical protein